MGTSEPRLSRPCSFAGCDRLQWSRGLCQLHYERQRKRGDPAFEYKSPVRPVAERFWEKVDKSGPTPTHVSGLGPCWLWTGLITTGGYGSVRVGSRRDRTARMVAAHRLAWEVTTGPIPDDQWVLHKCDNRACVNPAHLFLGDVAANVHDMDSKGRRRSGDNRGERHGMAKLTAEIVRAIRAKYATGTATQGEIAKEYGIGQMTVSNIVRRVRWNHV